MSRFSACVALTVVLTCVPWAAAQEGPYVSGRAGVSAGDGSSAPVGAAAIGWMTSRRVGFELEVAVATGLDLTGDRDVTRFTRPATSIFPLPTFESSGRLITFQTNALVSTGWRGRWNITAIAGGGVANLRQRTRIGYLDFAFPADFLFGSGFLGELTSLGLPWIEDEIVSSDSALCLNAGGSVEHAITRRISAGVDARYLHAFFGEEGLRTARILGGISWRF